ncbi:hypothetical protein [Acidomonas methanolica]|uniref:hypothetical protein n=1 Tax=Acidomonas methanolica TaxID=437 RepID=UPI00130DEBAC|nr:hypothetical protein [Acidomonas methanolica]MBU2654802.1 hypothetical protein [Acidomonas methanolica]
MENGTGYSMPHEGRQASPYNATKIRAGKWQPPVMRRNFPEKSLNLPQRAVI